MYTGAALSFGLIRACRGGLVLYCSVLSDAGGENDGSSAIFERSLLQLHYLTHLYLGSTLGDFPVYTTKVVYFFFKRLERENFG